MTEISKEYNGHTITINDDSTMRFRVQGPIVETWCDRYLEAQTIIDAAVAEHEAQKRRRIAIKVLNETGDECTVTGVHASNGNVLGLAKNDRFGLYANYYPALPWIGETIERIRSLSTEAVRLKQSLDPFLMRGDGRDVRPGRTHAQKVDNLVALIEEKTAAAQAAAPPGKGSGK